VSVLFAPFSITLYPSHDYVTVFIGDANFTSIWTPLHVLHNRSFSIVNHLFHPLSVVFHENDDSASRVTSGEFSVLLIPNYDCDVASVIGQVCALVALRRISLCFKIVEFDEFKKSLTCSNGKPAFVVVPGAGRCE
jgi:hypothetical protein